MTVKEVTLLIVDLRDVIPDQHEFRPVRVVIFDRGIVTTTTTTAAAACLLVVVIIIVITIVDGVVVVVAVVETSRHNFVHEIE